MIGVDFREELIQLRIRDNQARLCKSSTEFVLVKPPVVITVYAVEQGKELLLGRFDESAEFLVRSRVR